MSNDNPMAVIGQVFAEAIDDAIKQAIGAERGIVVLICAGPPGEPGDGLMFTNIDHASVKQLLTDTAETFQPFQTPPAH